MIRKLHSTDDDFEASLAAMAHSARAWDEKTLDEVRAIIAQLRRNGDQALLEYTVQYDRHTVQDAAGLEIPLARAREALQTLPREQRRALQFAARRIREYHERQREAQGADWHYRDEEGWILGQAQRPVQRVGVYAPGGQAAYPSTVLMTAIPARVAGVAEIILATPATGGKIDDSLLAAAALAEVDRIFSIGGAQALAALAFGTRTIPRVDKIAGPGNRYVAAAKQLLYGQVGLDMIAGPSEVLIIADGSGAVDWAVLDMFAQAEHDIDAQALLLSPDAGFLERAEQRIAALLPEMERAELIRQSLEQHGALIRVRDLKEAAEISNRIAPEHLCLAVAEPQRLLPRLHNAGAIFLGHHAAEVIGDYCAGPSHVLPTAGTARFSSALGVQDFVRGISLVGVAPRHSDRLLRTAAILARTEGFEAHARAAECRLQPAAAEPGAEGGQRRTTGEPS